MEKDEKYTPVTDTLKTEIKRAVAIEGGFTSASLVWGISERRVRQVLYGQKFVTLSWLDRFFCVAITEFSITDFEWSTYKELIDDGLWEAPVRRELNHPCKSCGKEVGKTRRKFCSFDCMRWWNVYGRKHRKEKLEHSSILSP